MPLINSGQIFKTNMLFGRCTLNLVRRMLETVYCRERLVKTIAHSQMFEFANNIQ